MRILLQHNAEVNALNGESCTPLDIASGGSAVVENIRHGWWTSEEARPLEESWSFQNPAEKEDAQSESWLTPSDDSEDCEQVFIMEMKEKREILRQHGGICSRDMDEQERLTKMPESCWPDLSIYLLNEITVSEYRKNRESGNWTEQASELVYSYGFAPWCQRLYF